MTDGRNSDGVAPMQRQQHGSDASQQALSELLGSYLSAHSSRDEIRSVLRPICQEARRSHTDIAELVKSVKHSFAASDLGVRLLHSGERQQTLDRIVSGCIEEYDAAS